MVTENNLYPERRRKRRRWKIDVSFGPYLIKKFVVKRVSAIIVIFFFYILNIILIY